VPAPGQETAPGDPFAPAPAADPAEADGLAPPEQVSVEPAAPDAEIARRLTRILSATEWFQNPRVEVQEGVAFLFGTTAEERFRTWAGDLARRTEDVAAVVNRIQVRERPAWDLAPVSRELDDLARRGLLALPYLLVGAVILTVAWWGGRGMSRLARRYLAPRLDAPLLREVLARIAGALVFLLGLYLVLRISGLTRLAVTVLGGTGLFGLVIGIAFRDITENFLASILLSMQRPFEPGDLVEIAADQGYVQRLTTRATVLMTLDGNHVQIPNSTVYKSPIHNFTSNPNRRLTFTVGIGYGDAIARAQEVALAVLANHPAVLRQPEPWVLVDGLGPSTVNLSVYFWIDGREHSWLKVKSSVIRLVKRAFQADGISMPSDVREVVFPQGVVVDLRAPEERPGPGSPVPAPPPQPESSDVSTSAEAGLGSDAREIEDQAARARTPEEGEDLLKGGRR
jgi:small-conductance mechanosensitive channel